MDVHFAKKLNSDGRGNTAKRKTRTKLYNMKSIHINTMRQMLAQPEPVDLTIVTTKGELQHYENCISLKADFKTGMRNIKMLKSGQIRKVRDVCILQINGMEVFI